MLVYNLRFGEFRPKGDPFTYESWNGHFDLLKLNLSNPSLRAHLFDAVAMWIDCFDIDGLGWMPLTVLIRIFTRIVWFYISAEARFLADGRGGP